MIGQDDNQEEIHYKVADKRKFNFDGSLREGVTLDAAPVAPEQNDLEPPKAEARDEEFISDPTGDDVPASDDGNELPGADDPASFVNFLSTLATNAAAALGAVPHPTTGKRSLDLDTGKYWLDVLGMIQEKTKGNLQPQESRLLDGLLGDLRMQYVHLVRATEDKMKAQAAQQFSGADILSSG